MLLLTTALFSLLSRFDDLSNFPYRINYKDSYNNFAI